jgi:hypothetical protein
VGGHAILTLLTACAAPDPTAPAAVELEPLARLARTSLDLRGRRPSETEIAAVEADPSALDELVATFVHDDAFADRLMSWNGDVFKTRADQFIPGVDGDGAFTDDAEKERFTRAVGDEPLRLLRELVAAERPWTELMTVDWTMANDELLAHWPLEDIDGTVESGWRRSRYTDGRPAAGVLTTTGLWWRYTSTAENVNRSRSEAIARILLCDQRFNRPIEFSSSAGTLDPTDLQERAQTDPNCVTCHVVLDPMGSSLFGFWRYHPESYTEASSYYPERETDWRELTGISPSFYGAPGDGIYDLARQVAADPRFIGCATEHAFTFLMGREPALADTATLTAWREAFVDGGATMQALYAAAVADPVYRQVDSLPIRRLSGDQYASAVADLTGFSWEYEGLGMLDNDKWGVRVLAGGADGIVVFDPGTDHSTTSALVQERLAESAASYAVATEAARAVGDRRLFRETADLSAVPDESALRTQLAALVLRVHTRRVTADDEEVDEMADLWLRLLDDTQEPATAWALLLSGLFRHPDFVHA